MTQLKLPGMDEVERQWAAALLRIMVERYPPTPEECDIMLSGIRIDRFVSNLECESCNFACEDHTVGWLFSTKVCLKDFYRKFPVVAREMSRKGE